MEESVVAVSVAYRDQERSEDFGSMGTVETEGDSGIAGPGLFPTSSAGLASMGDQKQLLQDSTCWCPCPILSLLQQFRLEEKRGQNNTPGFVAPPVTYQELPADVGCSTRVASWWGTGGWWQEPAQVLGKIQLCLHPSLACLRVQLWIAKGDGQPGLLTLPC